ncbi:demethylspheroidene O-methyltransferase [Candidatus Phycosocius bacilliformis]|uniref:Demethylspheroidene O-methyltransferase n=1 Tax=Candidatus Phycosocius bacilliformis TaxID=1445552 RepID=A0A2P2E760_9PROT|nr:methyltransferase [Candidatus Phycosocius bacilliformis]GBF56898.1 demethylspheroidene O-methyltransferase [Candidatus Phycosocius bacilliformis]
MRLQSWSDAWAAWRNRLVSSPRFQHWAAGFLLTRPIAHASADRLFGLVAGFVYSQVLLACVRLKLLDLLAEGPLNAKQLAEAMDLPSEGAARLLAAAQSLGLVEAAGPERYRLGLEGAALLGNAGLQDMIAHHALFYTDLADPVALLKQGGGQGQLAAFWPYAAYDKPDESGFEATSPYSRLMAATQPMIAADILHAYPLGGHHLLMDVGGGAGAFAIAAATETPSLKVRVFDLPAVAGQARLAFSTAGLDARAEALGGNFLTDDLPAGADIISFVRILHDHDDATVMKLLTAARAAVAQNGVVMIAEPMSAAPARDPMAEAYFGLYLFAMGRGRARTPRELTSMARQAGFSRIVNKPTRTPMLVRVLIAYP